MVTELREREEMCVVRLADLDAAERARLLAKCDPPLGPDVFVAPTKPLHERVFALVTTAGLHGRSDARFGFVETGYREIPTETAPAELLMSQSSVNFDRTGFQDDTEVVFPLARFKELAAAGTIGGLGPAHFAFVGALASPAAYRPAATQLASILHASGVDSVFLTPV